MFGSKKRAVRARIAQAALPAEVSRFIAEVVRRTRLRRAEQVDVAGELVSHFAEGLAAGRAERDLIAAYGDPRSSARELRRSTIAKRHAVDRAVGSVFRWGCIATGCLVAAYTGYAALLSLRSPVISFDAEAAANARLPKAGSEGRAIEVYMEALGDAGGVYDEPLMAETARELDDHLFAIEYDGRALAAARAAIEPMRARIAALRAVAQRPVLGIPVRARAWEDTRAATFFGVPTATPGKRDGVLASSLLGAVLPQIAMLRSAARIVCADAALAAHDGRADEFVADAEAALAMAAHAGENGTLIGGLVESAIHAMTAATVATAIENHAEMLGDAQLERLEARLAAAARVSGDRIARAIEGEGILHRDMIQRCYSDDGHGDGVLLSGPYLEAIQSLATWSPELGEQPPLGEGMLRDTAVFLGGPLAATMVPSRRETLERVDRYLEGLAAAARASTRAESIALAEQLDRAWEDWAERDFATQPVSMLMPALGRVITSSWGMRAATDSALAAIGLERFRRAKGRFPADLAELRTFVGRDLGSASDERIPWMYALLDGRPLIYDAGADGYDDRARTPEVAWPLPRASGADDAPRAGVRPRLVSLSQCGADSARHIGPPTGDRGGETSRTRSTVDSDALPDPLQPLIDVEDAALTARDGDHVRVWWKSGASGASRLVPARPQPQPGS
jgi:hypothetical protein